MFDIQPGNKYKLHDKLYVRKRMLDQTHGVFGKWGASAYISALYTAVTDGIVTISSIRNKKFIIDKTTKDNNQLFILEWMIKAYIAE
jgi:hypothetical protein